MIERSTMLAVPQGRRWRAASWRRHLHALEELGRRLQLGADDRRFRDVTVTSAPEFPESQAP